jgi:hypothetical protein
MDALQAQALRLEAAVFFHPADLLKREVDLLFYDTTPCTFAIDEDDEDDLRRFGRPQDGTWAPRGAWWRWRSLGRGCRCAAGCFRATLRMSPRSSAIQRRASRGWKLGRAIFVADAGMHSEANREELARGMGK